VYGKAFESMYEGSMVGAGINVFAVWNYCIAKNRFGVIELNPRLLAFILGGKQSEVEAAIEFLCKPDKESRSDEDQGCRLIREGEFQYRMVNWGKYDAMKQENDRREYNRVAQRKHREANRMKKMRPGGPLPGEMPFVRKFEAGIVDRNGEPIPTPPTASDTTR
jgi:hypothetical protein